MRIDHEQRSLDVPDAFTRDAEMSYLTAGLALSGAAIGFAFRWHALLPIVVLVPLIVIIFSVSRGSSFETTAVGILIAEAGLQGGYVVGLLLRLLVPLIKPRSVAAGPRETRAAGKDDQRHPAPPPSGA
uniref:hypothetical protein n=1 Tax=Bradyrhizobium sp. (strain ORS 278) TaxID=114615 RepID=UPI0002D9C790|nr:hypothetical protein [Bradyrhizobium sp. ORS 278]